MRKRLLFIAFTIAFSIVSHEQQAPTEEKQHKEQITSMTSNAVINKDGAVHITETIVVTVTGEKIKEGLNRNIPVTYQDKNGTYYSCNLTVKQVLMNGEDEPYKILSIGDNKRIVTGKPGELLQPGTYTYQLIYETDRQLGSGKDRDNFFWHVFSNSPLPLQQLGATISTPIPLSEKNSDLTVYVGKSKTDNKQYSANYIDGKAHFVLTKPLEPEESFTINVTLPKGVIAFPTLIERVQQFFTDNYNILLLLLCLFGVVLLYCITWFFTGMTLGTASPLATPPSQLSPEAARYIVEQHFDPKIFTVMVFNLATKGYISIKYEKGGLLYGSLFTLLKKKAIPETDVLSKEVTDVLFSQGNVVTLDKEKQALIRRTRNTLVDFLHTTYGNCFATPLVPTVLGVAGSLGAIGYAYYLQSFGFISLGLTLIIALVNAAFIYTLKRYTKKGRALYKELTQFKKFLADQAAKTNKNEDTLFEQYLPYAIAFDIEKEWITNQWVNETPEWYTSKIPFDSTIYLTLIGELTNNMNEHVSSSHTPPRFTLQ